MTRNERLSLVNMKIDSYASLLNMGLDVNPNKLRRLVRQRRKLRQKIRRAA